MLFSILKWQAKARLVVLLIALSAVNSRLLADSNAVTLTVEQSTNGLASWIPVQTFTATNVPTNFTNYLYRTRLAMEPLPPSGNMITVEGGTLPQTAALAGESVATFQIGKYEVTWDEWQEVRSWAVENGYSDLAGAGEGSGGDHPVRNVGYYDVIKWINAKSEKEMLLPAYRDGESVYRYGYGNPPFLQSDANGYRLPTEAEWEWAARGGILSQGYAYSGGNDVNTVAWYSSNSTGASVNLSGGRGTWPVGQKAANELGIHDMSGNVREYTIDENASVGTDGFGLNTRGGDWGTPAYVIETAFRFSSYTVGDTRNNQLGLRVARNAPVPVLGTVILTLEESANGPNKWQAAEIAKKAFNNGRAILPTPPGSAFYRMAIGKRAIDPQAPGIAVSPNAYNNFWTIFAYNSYGSFDVFPVTISNTGGSPLVVSGVYKASSSSSYQYRLDSSPLTIPAGQSTNTFVVIHLSLGRSYLIHDRIFVNSNASHGSSNITIKGSHWVDYAGGGPGGPSDPNQW